MNCSCCGKSRPIVWSDYASADKRSKPTFPGATANLCYSCLDFLGWKKEKNELMPFVRLCSGCKYYFLPKKNSQTKCSVCWSNFFRIKNEVLGCKK
jgi:hypothetical protein